MSVSEDLLCAFELLKVRGNVGVLERKADRHHYRSQPLDSAQLKRDLAKARRRLSSGSSSTAAAA